MLDYQQGGIVLNSRTTFGQTGFTLIELMIGVVILAILASVAIPSFQNWLLNSQIRNAAESISNGLQRTRAEAVGRNMEVEFELSADSSWVVRVVDGADIESRSKTEGSKSVAITPDPAGSLFITFTGFGGVKGISSDGNPPFTSVTVDSTVLPATESKELRIDIGTGGNIRMCNPNMPSGNPSAC